MTPGMLRHLRELVRAGATVLGGKPRWSPSLSDRARADREVGELADELWGKTEASAGEQAVGSGRVIWGRTLDEALKAVNCPPAFTAKGASTVLFAQRATGDAQIFFLSNQAGKDVQFTGVFRAAAGMVPELWDPATGGREAAAVYRADAGTVELPLCLGPRGSVFVVFRKMPERDHWVSISRDGVPVGAAVDFRIEMDRAASRLAAWTPGRYELLAASGRKQTVEVLSVPAALDLSADWEVSFEALNRKQKFDKLVSWTTLPEEELRNFSGSVIYRKRFNWSSSATRVDLDLGEMKNIAEVTLNGTAVGLLWKPPFRLDVTQALKPGENELVVRVTNLLVNRITGDYALPPEQRHMHAFGAIEQYRAGAEKDGLLPSGLFGPVALRCAVVRQLE